MGGSAPLILYKNGLAGLLVGVSFGFATIKILGSTQVRASLGDVASRLSLTQGHRSLRHRGSFHFEVCFSAPKILTVATALNP